MKMLKQMAQEEASRILEDRRFLHAHAETGFDLPETFAYVWRTLEEMGLTPRRCGRCGIVADIGQGSPAVLLRADMDALPVREETEEPFASGNGCMHACGHDLHTAMLLGAARILKRLEGKWQRTVRLMFQPAEEILQGARDMLDNGLLEGADIQAAFMVHVLTNLELPAGTAIVSAPGVSAPAAATFEIRIRGKGCHGAMPHTGVDPITTAAHLVLALQQIGTRELSLNQPSALTIGMLQAGKTANVIPDSAVLRGSMRAFDEETKDFILRRIREIAVQTAAVFRAEAEVKILSECPTLLNDESLITMTLGTLQSLLGRERALLSSALSGAGARSTGSEDFASVSHAVPSVMIALAAGNPAEGYASPAHHPKARFDESVLPEGAAIYSALALQLLQGRK